MRDQADTLSQRPKKMCVWGILLSTVEQGPATAAADSGDFLVPSDALKGPAVSPKPGFSTESQEKVRQDWLPTPNQRV